MKTILECCLRALKKQGQHGQEGHALAAFPSLGEIIRAGSSQEHSRGKGKTKTNRIMQQKWGHLWQPMPRCSTKKLCHATEIQCKRFIGGGNKKPSWSGDMRERWKEMGRQNGQDRE